MTPFEITNKAVDQVRDNHFNYYQKVIDFAETWVKSKMKPSTRQEMTNQFNPVCSDLFSENFQKTS
jgi:hypothetical protein